eukprot:TRINITY_DN2545_c0_g1_i3.p1 TRINITY_DN2545_c0_g1~~TRINITY_DN2545_c0_g1_i3.p1  ORF type:complete len:176 (+),score=27.31 TRINITY_DN2545_c0_g1_i3:32-529(+)
MTDIRKLTKERFLSMLRLSNEASPAATWKVLVIDEGTTPLISAACTMFDITEENVSTVEGLEKRRRPFPNMEAVYFISPTEPSIALLNQDFADRSEPHYKCAHIFFPTSATPAPPSEYPHFIGSSCNILYTCYSPPSSYSLHAANEQSICTHTPLLAFIHTNSPQ